MPVAFIWKTRSWKCQICIIQFFNCWCTMGKIASLKSKWTGRIQAIVLEHLMCIFLQHNYTHKNGAYLSLKWMKYNLLNVLKLSLHNSLVIPIIKEEKSFISEDLAENFCRLSWVFCPENKSFARHNWKKLRVF